jgi:hypothetical protein
MDGQLKFNAGFKGMDVASRPPIWWATALPVS